MSQLVSKAKQAADAEKEIFDKFGADLKQAWETNFSPEKLSTAKIPTAKDFENLKAQAKAAQQQGTTQTTNNQGTTQNTENKDSNSIQQRDAEANAQCWPNCGNSWLDWWDYLPGCQNFYPFDLYPHTGTTTTSTTPHAGEHTPSVVTGAHTMRTATSALAQASMSALVVVASASASVWDWASTCSRMSSRLAKTGIITSRFTTITTILSETWSLRTNLGTKRAQRAFLIKI